MNRALEIGSDYIHRLAMHHGRRKAYHEKRLRDLETENVPYTIGSIASAWYNGAWAWLKTGAC